MNKPQTPFGVGRHTVTVAVSPSDAGTVSSAPAQPQYIHGTTVTLTATAASGYRFAGWQGDAAGATNPITLKVDSNKTVTAAFASIAPDQFALSVSASPTDAGTIARAPDQPQYIAGTVVTLTATAGSGYQFTGWQGDATGATNPIIVKMDGNKTVTASFTPSQFTVAVSVSPSNAGTIARAPDQPEYVAGTIVMVTATPASGYQFTGWQGDVTGTSNPIAVTVDGNKTIAGAFSLMAPSVSAPSRVSGDPASYGVSVVYPTTNRYSERDRMELEESSGGAAFNQVANRGGVISPWTVSLVRSAGTYRYRARVYLDALSTYSPYSASSETVVEAPPPTRFVNDTQDSMSIISLKIDGVEKLRAAEQILPEATLEITVPQGVHRYETVHGYLDTSGRHDLYTRAGTYTQASDAGVVAVPGRTLVDLLTPYYWIGTCIDQVTGAPYRTTFRFYRDGTYDWDASVGNTYSYAGQRPATHVVRFYLGGYVYADLGVLIPAIQASCPDLENRTSYFPSTTPAKQPNTGRPIAGGSAIRFGAQGEVYLRLQGQLADPSNGPAFVAGEPSSSAALPFAPGNLSRRPRFRESRMGRTDSTNPVTSRRKSFQRAYLSRHAQVIPACIAWLP